MEFALLSVAGAAALAVVLIPFHLARSNPGGAVILGAALVLALLFAMFGAVLSFEAGNGWLEPAHDQGRNAAGIVVIGVAAVMVLAGIAISFTLGPRDEGDGTSRSNSPGT